MDSFSCACELCCDTMVAEQPVCLSEPFGEDESYLPFLLRLFEGGEDNEDEDVLAPAQVNEIEEGEDDKDEDVLALARVNEIEGGGARVNEIEEGGEDDEDEDMLTPAQVNEIEGGEEDEDEDVLAPPRVNEIEGGEKDEDEDEDVLAPPRVNEIEGGEEDEDEDEDVLAPARVNEIEEVDVEASDGGHQSQMQSNRDENDDDQHIRQGTIEDIHPPARSVCKKHVFLCTLAACITSFSLAYVQAAMSGAAPYIEIDLKVSDLHLDIVMGAQSVITMSGLVMARWVSDRFGRRKTIMVAGAMYFVGPLIMGFAPSYAVFLLGRAFATFGAGFAIMIAPMYVTEISPLFSRGFYVSFPQMFISVGNQVANLSTFYFSKFTLNRGWRGMLLVGAIPSVVLVFGVFALSESPQWLVMRGRLRDAKRILAKTSKSEEEAALRFADIKKAAGIPEECDDDVYTNANQNTDVWWDILHPTWSSVHMLLCAIGIQVVQQACGMDTLALFSPKVFERVRITTAAAKLVANMVIEIVKIVVILLASYLADRVGRRPLLLSSMGGVFLSLVSVGLFLTLKVSWAVQVSAIFYVIFFSIGLGPITDVYCTEIIPLRMRAQAYTIGLGFKQGVSVALSSTYLLMFKAITLGGAAFLFGGIAIVGCVLFYILMPETRGKTLDEIGQLFGRLRRTAAKDLEMQRTEAAVSS